MKRIKWEHYLVAFAICFCYACDDDDDDNNLSDSPDTAIESIASSEMMADELSEDIDNNVDDEIASFDIELKSTQKKKEGRIGKSGATITIDTLENDPLYKFQITFDYAEGKEGKRGNKRSGKIIVKKGGDFTKKTKFQHISFDNFAINNISLSGTKEKVKVANEDNGIYFNDSFNITINDTLKQSGYKSRKFTTGYDTRARSDDEFTINGKDTLKTPSDTKYRELKDVVRKAIYRFPISGTVSVKSDTKDYVIDYGDGTLDSLATITSDGKTVEFVLSKESKLKGKARRDK